ncbi:MAG: hypothetical protein M3M88_03635 [Thermoproteota archaeon]|nr:hypothetical protein [Thermoproteota archaeon]
MGFFSFLRKEGENSGHKHYNRIDNSFIDNQAISSLLKSYVKLDDSLGLKSTGKCGILVKNVNIPKFADMKQYIDNVIANISDKQKMGWELTCRSAIDDYGYLWFILEGKAIEEIVVALNAIGDIVHEKGFSRQLLAAVFELTSGYGVSKNAFLNNNVLTTDNNTNQYLIYNYKYDKFYPFIPLSSSKGMVDGSGKKRNYEQELKIMAQITDDLPCEKDANLWYPIWNIPF